MNTSITDDQYDIFYSMSSSSSAFTRLVIHLVVDVARPIVWPFVFRFVSPAITRLIVAATRTLVKCPDGTLRPLDPDAKICDRMSQKKLYDSARKR